MSKRRGCVPTYVMLPLCVYLFVHSTHCGIGLREKAQISTFLALTGALNVTIYATTDSKGIYGYVKSSFRAKNFTNLSGCQHIQSQVCSH